MNAVDKCFRFVGVSGRGKMLSGKKLVLRSFLRHVQPTTTSAEVSQSEPFAQRLAHNPSSVTTD